MLATTKFDAFREKLLHEVSILSATQALREELMQVMRYQTRSPQTGMKTHCRKLKRRCIDAVIE
jgi:hypothetical protein